MKVTYNGGKMNFLTKKEKKMEAKEKIKTITEKKENTKNC